MSKTHSYKVYNTANTFIGLWDNDVLSEFERKKEINQGGSEIKVRLGRPFDDFGEGVDVGHNFIVKVYSIDSDDPNGTLVFTGRIKKYTPYSGTSEYVEVVILGGGSDMNDIMIDWGPSIINENKDSMEYFASSGINNYVMLQTFTLDVETRVPSIDLFVSSNDASVQFMTIGTGTPADYSAALIAGIYYSSKLVSDIDPAINTFTFSEGPILPAGDYFFMVEVLDHGSSLNNRIGVNTSTDTYTDGSCYQCTDSVSDPSQTFSALSYDLWFRINAGTVQPFYSTDPSNMLRTILDHYIEQGGLISYDGSSIDDTGTVATYTFNGNTTLEGVQKVLDMAPVGWYWYVDQNTNLLHFHRKSESADHRFVFGRHLLTVKPEKRIEDVVDIVYFTGGGTPPLSLSFPRPTFVNNGAVRKYIDGRVTDAHTASLIAKRILDANDAPEIRLSFEVVDNTVDTARGYDLESIQIGDTMKLGNIGSGGSSLWGVMVWNVDYWGYSVQDLGTLVLQIVRIEESKNSAKLFCSTVAPDVSKRIEDINRNLQAAQTSNNSAATEG
jgi:hypothetical protein